MYFGAHISASGGLHNAPANSAKIGGECFQFFSRPPQGGLAKPLDRESIDRFVKAMKRYKQKTAYIHAPYYINFASSNNRIRYGSISVVRQELERGSLLGVKAVMTHLGSANDLLKSGLSKNKAQQQGLKMVIEGVQKILDGYKGSCQLLLEISAGAGLVIGDTFEEISAIIAGVEAKKLRSYQLLAKVFVCLDTQHAFASGYDMRVSSLRGAVATKQSRKKRSDGVSGSPRADAIGPRDDRGVGVNAVINQFDRIIGLDRLVVFHCNDSKVDLGSHVDRHADLGDGKIGLPAFEALVQNKKLKHCDLILETPTEEKRARDITALKKFRGIH